MRRIVVHNHLVLDDAFNEADHPRGQPKNAGQFVEAGGRGGGSGKTGGGGKLFSPRDAAAQRKVDAVIKSMREDAEKSIGSLRERLVVMNRETGEILDDHQQELQLNVASMTHELKEGSGFSNASWFNEKGDYHPDNSILDLHTHPLDQSFSDGDWRVFSRHTIGEMKVVSKGFEFSLTKTPEYLAMPWQERTPAIIGKAFSDHVDKVADEILAASGTDVPDRFVDMVIGEANVRTAKQFHIDYDVKPL